MRIKNKLQNADPIFKEFDFLKLLIVNLNKNNYTLIEKHSLEKKLLEFYDCSEFHFLFEDICPKRDALVKDGNYVDLSKSFMEAYIFGLLIQMHDTSSDVRVVIPFYTEEEINQIISCYDEKHIEGMENMVDALLKKEEQLNSDSPSLIKKI